MQPMGREMSLEMHPNTKGLLLIQSTVNFLDLEAKFTHIQPQKVVCISIHLPRHGFENQIGSTKPTKESI